MSIFTWWAVVYGVSCGLLTFLPERYVFLWVLSSIPFYIYLFCSYMNYLLFYEQVETAFELDMPSEEVLYEEVDEELIAPSYYTDITEKIMAWKEENGKFYYDSGILVDYGQVFFYSGQTFSRWREIKRTEDGIEWLCCRLVKSE